MRPFGQLVLFNVCQFHQRLWKWFYVRISLNEVENSVSGTWKLNEQYIESSGSRAVGKKDICIANFHINVKHANVWYKWAKRMVFKISSSKNNFSFCIKIKCVRRTAFVHGALHLNKSSLHVLRNSSGYARKLWYFRYRFAAYARLGKAGGKVSRQTEGSQMSESWKVYRNYLSFHQKV